MTQPCSSSVQNPAIQQNSYQESYVRHQSALSSVNVLVVLLYYSASLAGNVRITTIQPLDLRNREYRSAKEASRTSSTLALKTKLQNKPTITLAYI